MHPTAKRSWIRASIVYVSFPWVSSIACVVLSSWGGLAFNPANPLFASQNGFLQRNHACVRSLAYSSCTRTRVSMIGKNSTPRGNVRTLQSLLSSKLIRIWNNRGDMRCLRLGASGPVSGDDTKVIDPEEDAFSDDHSHDGMVPTEKVPLKLTQGQVGKVPELVSSKRGSGTLRRIVERAIEIPEFAADEGKYLAMAAFVGVMTGTAVTFFKLAIDLVKDVTFGGLVSRFPERVTAFVAGSVPLLGAIAVVAVMKLLRLESYGPGLGGLTKEVEKQVPWSLRRTVGKTLAAAATLGTGNSLGPEGPAVELGVAASRCASSMSKLSVERQRMLLGAGAAGGVAAGFNAPIAGIFFALEIVRDTFSTNINGKSFIAGTLLCSVVSALIAKIGLHDELSLRPAAYDLKSPLIELPLYLGLGMIAGLVAVMFKLFSRKSAELFEGDIPGFGWMKRVPQWMKPMSMAAVTGLVGIAVPQVLFFGYETLDSLLANTGQYSVRFLCFLCVTKAVLTAGALGSGLVGGTFAPSLFLGATAGAAYQRVLQGGLNALRTTASPTLSDLSGALFPVTSILGIGGPTGDLGKVLRVAGSPAYAMVGAAAVLSALYRAPLTGSLLLFELTKDYDIVLPLMAAAGVSSLVVEVFSRADDAAAAKRVTAAMPRDMSLEMGLKVSGETDALVGNVQVTEALVPRVLTLAPDVPLRETMLAFRETRSEFAIVVKPTGQDVTAPKNLRPTETFAANDLWKRKDLRLVGFLALREITLAMEREKYRQRTAGPVVEDLTAGGICRTDCFTIKANSDIMMAKGLMNSKGVRFLPVVTAGPTSDAQEPGSPEGQVVVGVLSRDSVRIAGRLTATERAVWEVSQPPVEA